VILSVVPINVKNFSEHSDFVLGPLAKCLTYPKQVYTILLARKNGPDMAGKEEKTYRAVQ
jgi:hypothetical protein